MKCSRVDLLPGIGNFGARVDLFAGKPAPTGSVSFEKLVFDAVTVGAGLPAKAA
jgi:hypothetical protein